MNEPMPNEQRRLIYVGVSSIGIGIVLALSWVWSIKESRGLPMEIRITSQEEGFDYKCRLEAAEKGDPEAIRALLDFGSKMDAGGSIAHGVVIFELLLQVGERPFIEAIRLMPTLDAAAVYRTLEVGIAYSPRAEQSASLSLLYPRLIEVLSPHLTSVDG